MKKKICAVLLSMSLIFAGGCGITGQGDKTTHTTADLKPFHMSEGDRQHQEFSLHEFDAGSGIYTSPWGQEMPYNISGIIGIPKGEGPFPLVLITHGSHDNENENNRFDTGFSYLVESLAAQGIISVSMDMSKAYIWKYGDSDDREKSRFLALQHIDSLIAANSAESSLYPESLEGKIDFDSVGLVGHSRGGETIFDIAEDITDRGVSVKSLLCIAPTVFFPDRKWPKVKVAVIVPEYDGDVIGLDGISLYEILSQETTGEQLAVFLRGANHNYWNSNIERNDAGMLSSSRDISDQMSRDNQEAFLQSFASDFFYRSLQNDLPLLSGGEQQPESMFGERMTLLYHNPKSQEVFSAQTEQYTTDNLTAQVKTDAWFFRQDELLADTITYGDGDYQSRRLFTLIWDSAPASLTITPDTTDWTEFNTLILDLVTDPSDGGNTEEYQQIAVRLKDTQGSTATLRTPKTFEALKKAPGELGETPLMDETIYYWSIPSPLCSIILPLSAFEGVVTSEIESLELLFEETPSGALLLETIRIQ